MPIDSITIINDPNFVPLATHEAEVLWTHDNEFIIVSSSLRVRSQQGNREWLKHPLELVRGGGRP